MYFFVVLLIAIASSTTGHFNFKDGNSEVGDELMTAIHNHFNDHETFHAEGYRVSPLEAFSPSSQQDVTITTGAIVAKGCFDTMVFAIGLGTCFSLYNAADVGLGSFYMRISFPSSSSSSSSKPSPKAKTSPKTAPGSSYDGATIYQMTTLIYRSLDCSGAVYRNPVFYLNTVHSSCPTLSNATEYVAIWYYESTLPALPNEMDLSYGLLAKYV